MKWNNCGWNPGSELHGGVLSFSNKNKNNTQKHSCTC